jgi:hypothetical protein
MDGPDAHTNAMSNQTPYKLSPGPGRTVGSKNKPKLPGHAELFACLQSQNFDPILEMIAVYRDPDTQNRTKFEICKELASYMYPKRKSVEHSGDVTHSHVAMAWADDVSAQAAIDVIASDTDSETNDTPAT